VDATRRTGGGQRQHQDGASYLSKPVRTALLFCAFHGDNVALSHLVGVYPLWFEQGLFQTDFCALPPTHVNQFFTY